MRALLIAGTSLFIAMTTITPAGAQFGRQPGNMCVTGVLSSCLRCCKINASQVSAACEDRCRAAARSGASKDDTKGRAAKKKGN